MRLIRAARTAVVLAALGLIAGLATAAPADAGVTAGTVTSIPTVGALFVPSVLGLGPALGLPHYCSASVVHSPSHDLVLTAAHCMFGPGLGIEFAPGFHDNLTPYGVWAVRRVYVDAAWMANQDPHHDFAVLQLARHNGHGVEDVTGPAAALGSAPASGSEVTVDGYVAGTGGRPITCTHRVYYTGAYPSFDCAGFAGGTSGGPWLAQGKVVGVIGGLHQGGCSPSTSYSSPFGAASAALLARAEQGRSGDFAPMAGSDGC